LLSLSHASLSSISSKVGLFSSAKMKFAKTILDSKREKLYRILLQPYTIITRRKLANSEKVRKKRGQETSKYTKLSK
jgi:hypothetical protein